MEETMDSVSGYLNEIEELSSNNDIPSDEIVEEVKRILNKHFRNLSDLDGEISQVERQLEGLRNKRSEMNKQIARYQAITSPIRRMPPDILGEIFYHSLPGYRNPIMKATESPMLLTHVCSKWRTAAISNPRLWARLYITFLDNTTLPQPLPRLTNPGAAAEWSYPASKTSVQRDAQRLRARIDTVKEWLSRSGSRPLSISIFLTQTYISGGLESISNCHSLTLEFLNLLASFSPRFEELELEMPLLVYLMWERMLTISQMTALVSLKCDLHSYTMHQDPSPIALLKAPNLRNLSMFSCAYGLWGLSDPSMRWSLLTCISCHTYMAFNDVIFLLETARNLIHFQAEDVKEDADTDMIFHQRCISLPFLRTFCITENISAHTQSLHNFYDRIVAPGLQAVSYRSRRPHDVFALDRPHPIPIISLLRKSTHLKKLNIDFYNIAKWDIGRFFHAVPNITHLVIGPEQRTATGCLTRRSYPSFGGLYSEEGVLWNIGGLIQDDSNAEHCAPLLPHLESIEISDMVANLVDDEKLRDFIISRTDPSSSSQTAILKYVGILFFRAKSVEIMEDIKRHSEAVGVAIDVHLVYTDEYTLPLDTISPRYGLSQALGGLSWKHAEYRDYELPQEK